MTRRTSGSWRGRHRNATGAPIQPHRPFHLDSLLKFTMSQRRLVYHVALLEGGRAIDAKIVSVSSGGFGSQAPLRHSLLNKLGSVNNGLVVVGLWYIKNTLLDKIFERTRPQHTMRPTGVTTTALELVLEEIHLRRKAALHHTTMKFSNDGRILDLEGESLKTLSLVHPAWTFLSRHTFGRILVLSDVTDHTAKAVASASNIGLWTREIHLSFSEGFSIPEKSEQEIWNYLRDLFLRTPGALAFNLTTASEHQFNIDSCVKRVSPMLSIFTRLRVLRLHSDDANRPLSDIIRNVTDHPVLFHSLEKAPLENVSLRGFLPCFKGVLRETNEELQVSRMPPVVGDSAVLAGRVYSLAKLIKSIYNSLGLAPEHPEKRSPATGLRYISFKFNTHRHEFFVSTMKLFDGLLSDPLPPRPYQDLFQDADVITVSCAYKIFKKLSPFHSLRFLHATINASHRSPPREAVQELDAFVHLLPPTLEVLIVGFALDSPEKDFSSAAQDKVDAIFTKIPSGLCPKLKMLGVKFFAESKICRTSELMQLINACKKAHIPLVIYDIDLSKGYWKTIGHGIDVEELEMFNFSNYLE
ncbi:hypothetical protein SCHPADRAFT_932878 [Schizopora paradoxa]|uniref:Uncharacterized protein n=1 Tax=Schizopora paradoxa TaxID=27342 RepID=A0A0H2R4J6_9AGAM|nr:hypothetical protein SCHPADRAFT_932878 [Schizopora paradoxa]